MSVGTSLGQCTRRALRRPRLLPTVGSCDVNVSITKIIFADAPRIQEVTLWKDVIESAAEPWPQPMPWPPLKTLKPENQPEPVSIVLQEPNMLP